jgi:hypothetical protein
MRGLALRARKIDGGVLASRQAGGGGDIPRHCVRRGADVWRGAVDGRRVRWWRREDVVVGRPGELDEEAGEEGEEEAAEDEERGAVADCALRVCGRHWVVGGELFERCGNRLTSVSVCATVGQGSDDLATEERARI